MSYTKSEIISKNKKIILKSQQRFKSDRHVFTEEIVKIYLSSNDVKRIQ